MLLRLNLSLDFLQGPEHFVTFLTSVEVRVLGKTLEIFHRPKTRKTLLALVTPVRYGVVLRFDNFLHVNSCIFHARY